MWPFGHLENVMIFQILGTVMVDAKPSKEDMHKVDSELDK
jgi:hypothetical protein